MLQVTEPAKEMLQSLDHPEGTVLKLEPLEGTDKIGLIAGVPDVGDQVVERAGTQVLHIPAELSAALDGSVIDVTQTEKGPRLSLQAPTDSDGG